MRFRLIGALAALLMIAPVAGFARTSAPIAQPTSLASSAAKASKKKKAAKKEKKAKPMHAKKKGAAKGKKKGQKGSR